MKVEIEEDKRVDKYLSEKLDISRNKIIDLIDDGKITVDGKSIKASAKLPIGTIVDVIYEFRETKAVAQNIKLDIVYEDEYLMIINKASGMVVHPAPGNMDNTLVNAILYHIGKSDSDSLRPGIVHRLDKDTSGLMIVAKTVKMEEVLSNMIKNKEIKREYLALVNGVIVEDSGTIDAPIGRNPNNRLAMAVTSVNSKDAITNFKVLKRYPNYTLVRCSLVTGRTHQIRVHMAYIGHPIYNDPVYSKKTSDSFGQYLHSASIEFTHPVSGKLIKYEVDVPEKFKSYLEKLDNLV